MVNPVTEKFPPRLRVVRSADYRALYKTGGKIHSSSFVLFSRGNALGHCRLGITVSRKVGSAVVRNRVKRRLRDIFRRVHTQIFSGFDLVINAKSIAARTGYAELLMEFLAAVKKLEARHPQT